MYTREGERLPAAPQVGDMRCVVRQRLADAMLLLIDYGPISTGYRVLYCRHGSCCGQSAIQVMAGKATRAQNFQTCTIPSAHGVALHMSWLLSKCNRGVWFDEVCRPWSAAQRISCAAWPNVRSALLSFDILLCKSVSCRLLSFSKVPFLFLSPILTDCMFLWGVWYSVCARYEGWNEMVKLLQACRTKKYSNHQQSAYLWALPRRRNLIQFLFPANVATSKQVMYTWCIQQ